MCDGKIYKKAWRACKCNSNICEDWSTAIAGRLFI
jgi:hypothetical protein